MWPGSLLRTLKATKEGTKQAKPLGKMQPDSQTLAVDRKDEYNRV